MSNPDRPTLHCGACGWLVYADAVRCKHCGADRAKLTSPGHAPERGRRCPACDGKVLPSSTRCKHCGADLPTRD
jgi:hypothetical protein